MSMLNKEIEDLVKNTGGKYIIVENGKPSYVAMSWKEYRNLIDSGKSSIKSLTEGELIDKINNNIAMWRESQENKEEDLIDEIEKLEDIEYI
jgi:transcriptional/translational regulatory protein YebC/TACO1